MDAVVMEGAAAVQAGRVEKAVAGLEVAGAAGAAGEGEMVAGTERSAGAQAVQVAALAAWVAVLAEAAMVGRVEEEASDTKPAAGPSWLALPAAGRQGAEGMMSPPCLPWPPWWRLASGGRARTLGSYLKEEADEGSRCSYKATNTMRRQPAGHCTRTTVSKSKVRVVRPMQPSLSHQEHRQWMAPEIVLVSLTSCLYRELQ